MPINAIASNNAIINGANKPATIVYSTESGTILEVLEDLVILDKTEITKYQIHTLEDVSPSTLLPGLVDSHVHLNEPGRTSWEGFETGTQAAISGGVTTVIDMPLNAIPPTTNVENLRLNWKLLRAKCGAMWDFGVVLYHTTYQIWFPLLKPVFVDSKDSCLTRGWKSSLPLVRNTSKRH